MKKKIFLSMILLMLGTVVVCEPAISQVKREKIEWVPSTIKGITPGKSKYKDVIRLFGKPDYEEAVLDCNLKPEDESQTALAYQNLKIEGVMVNIVGVYVGEETKLVKDIYLEFYKTEEKDKMTKEEVVRKYGTDYYLITNPDYNNNIITQGHESLCVYKPQKRKREVKVDGSDYPIYLVYPQKGMYVHVRSDNKVDSIYYMDKCE